MNDEVTESPWIPGQTWGQNLARADNFTDRTDALTLATDYEVHELTRYLTEWLRLACEDNMRRHIERQTEILDLNTEARNER